MGYLTNFIVYTLAMTGVMTFALIIFKKATSGGNGGSSKFLKVVDTMSIGPRKTLYIVSAGEEKFLIAGDVDKTVLISKLNPQSTYEKPAGGADVIEDKYSTAGKFKDIMKSAALKTQYMDKSITGISSGQINKKGLNDTVYTPVMKNLAYKMNSEAGGKK